MERSDFAARFGKFALVGGASLAVIVVAGLLVSIKRDEDRLRSLEARLASQAAAAPESDLATAPPAVSDVAAPDQSRPPSPETASTEDRQLAGEKRPASPPQTARPLTEPPQSVETKSPAVAASPALLPDAADTLADADAYSLPATAPELETSGTAFTSWFSSGELGGLPQELQPKVCAADRSLGTVLTWCKSPEEAEATARRERKLVFLIHVSGNFEDAGFT